MLKKKKKKTVNKCSPNVYPRETYMQHARTYNVSHTIIGNILMKSRPNHDYEDVQNYGTILYSYKENKPS